MSKWNTNTGHPSHQDALNRMSPAAAKAGLGDVIYDIINKVNAALKRLDAAGTALVSATVAAVYTGSGLAAADTTAITITNSKINGLPVTKTLTLGAGETVTTVAAKMATLINNDTVLATANISAVSNAGTLTISEPGTVGNSTVATGTFSAHGTVTIANSGTLSGGAGTFGTDNFATFGIALPEART